MSPSSTVLLLGIMALKLSLSPGPERPRESDHGVILGLCSPGIVVQVALRERTGCVAWQWLASQRSGGKNSLQKNLLDPAQTGYLSKQKDYANWD